MNKTLLSLATLPLVAALAAPASAQSFSGPFVGADIAYETGSMKNYTGWEASNGDYGTYHEEGRSINGIAGGVFVGYDAPITDTLFGGIELRARISDAKYDIHDDIRVDDLDLERHSHLAYRAKESFSATARLGYRLNDKTGLYVRGGVAQTKLKAHNDDGFNISYDPIEDEFGYVTKANDNNIGLVLGAGLESAFSDKLSLRLEYNFTNYGTIFNDLLQQISDAESARYGDPQTDTSKLHTQQVRVGLSYRF